MSKQLRFLGRLGLAALSMLVGGGPAHALITTSVTLNSTTNLAGIAAWPNAPTVDVTALAANPGAFMNVTEGNLGNAIDGFNFAQSFTATTNGKLTRIQLPITGMAPQNITLHVYDGLALDWTDISIFDPNMDTVGDQYVPGTHVSNDLLTDTTVQVWNGYTLMGATAAVLDFSLSGADQIDIVSGKTYIVEFELDPAFNSQLLLGRNGQNGDNTTNYLGGQAFRARKPLNGNPLRDIGMAFTITAPSTLAADFNSIDGVNAADLGIWRSGYGTGTTKAQGDADLDSDVDGNDFLIWQRQLGLAGVTVATTAVPEPVAAALACVAASMLAAVTRRREDNRGPASSC